MRGWLIANRYAVSAVALTVLCVIALAILVQPQACARHRPNAPTPAPTLQPVDITAQPNPSQASEPPSEVDETEPALPPWQTQGALQVCGAGGDLDWSTTADDLQTVCKCTITLPDDGWAYISAGASLTGCNCEYEAQFRLGIDSKKGDPATDRWINIYADSGDGMDAVLAVSALRPLKAGKHTFYLLCRRASGTGTVFLQDPSLAVIAGQ